MLKEKPVITHLNSLKLLKLTSFFNQTKFHLIELIGLFWVSKDTRKKFRSFLNSQQETLIN